MNLVADESVDAPIVEQLRSDGHELIYMAELDPGVPDDVVLDRANAEGRLLLTADKDFGELVFRIGRVTGGVILIHVVRKNCSEQILRPQILRPEIGAPRGGRRARARSSPARRPDAPYGGRRLMAARFRRGGARRLYHGSMVSLRTRAQLARAWMQFVLLLLMMGLAACGGPPPQVLSGRTVTAGGTGVAATVRVLAVPDDGRDWPVAASAESDPDGTFTMEVPSGGRLAALAEAPGLRSPCVFVERGHLRSAFVFVLRPALPPEVLVLDDGGAPAVGAEVHLHEAVEGCLSPLGPSAWRPLAVAVPDTAGRCVLLPAPPATGRITARAAGFPIATVAPLPTAGPVEVRLHRGRLLEGIVLDGDGARVKGARVEAAGVTTITDDAGRFLLDSVPSPGQFWLSADAGARGRAERSISGPWRLRNLKAPRDAPKSEPGAERRKETMRLEPVRRIAGRILLLVDGELAPAPGITLKAWEQGPSRPWGQRPSHPAAVSGSDGAFTLDGIPPGETALELPDPDLCFACVYFGRPMEWFTVPLLESDLDLVVMRRDPPWPAPPQIRVDAIPVARQERVLERPVTSKLPDRSASISGFVRDPEGRPLPGARVHAVPDPDPSVPDMQMVSSEHWEVRTNSLGRFWIQDLVGDRFALEVCGSYATGARLRGVPAAAEKVVLIADENWFETAQRIEGRVLDAGGRGVAGVKVRGDPEGFRGVSREETTDAEGRFWLPGLRPGPHRVTATADGRRPVVLSGVLCGRQDLRVHLP